LWTGDGNGRSRTLDSRGLTSRIAFASPGDDKAQSPESSGIALVRPSFEEVYQETFPFVWRTVRRLGVVDSTRDDVTQEVFVTVYRRLGEFQGRCSVKTWVFNILMGIVRNYRRTRRRKGKGHALLTAVVDPAVLADATADPSELASRAQAGRILHELLDELAEEKAVVFVMADLEGMTVPEIAGLVNANVNTVYSRLRAARSEFEQALQRLHAAGAKGGGGSPR
jgi:RNA polymerase sigma-70 factor (ECF subfamily)